jgi:hypothetical protein
MTRRNRHARGHRQPPDLPVDALLAGNPVPDYPVFTADQTGTTEFCRQPDNCRIDCHDCHCDLDRNEERSWLTS